MFHLESSDSESDTPTGFQPSRRDVNATKRYRGHPRRCRYSKSRQQDCCGFREGTTETLDGDDEAHRESVLSLPSVNTTNDNEEDSNCKMQLSDPNSWVWKDRVHAKLAVVISTAKQSISISSAYSPATNLACNNVQEEEDVVLGKPTGRLWLHSIKSKLLAALLFSIWIIWKRQLCLEHLEAF